MFYDSHLSTLLRVSGEKLNLPISFFSGAIIGDRDRKRAPFPRGSQDLRSPSLIMAPGFLYFFVGIPGFLSFVKNGTLF